MTWNQTRLKYLADINRAVLPENTDPNFEIRYVDISAVGHGELVSEPRVVRFGEAPSRARRLVAPGDTIVSTVRTYLRAVWPVSGSVEGLVASTGFAVISPRSAVYPPFLSWYLQSDRFVQEVVARSKGVSYPAINPSDLGATVVTFPTRSQQRAIADFLDVETSRIDALISKKGSVLGLLDDRFRSLVRLAVTGQGDAERRSSSLPWVGSLPSAWRTVPLHSVAKMGSGHTPARSRREFWEHCTIPWISLFDVGRLRDPYQESLSETAQQISPLGLANSSARIHPAGTVVLSRTASVGFSTIMGRPMAVSQHFVTWTCGPRLKPEYLLYLLRAMEQHWRALEVGTTNVTVFMPDLHALRVPLPPTEVQTEIIVRIRSSVRSTRTALVSLTRQIDLLAERRRALITAAVTGELDIARSISEEAS